jgi:hypothetical protein
MFWGLIGSAVIVLGAALLSTKTIGYDAGIVFVVAGGGCVGNAVRHYLAEDGHSLAGAIASARRLSRRVADRLRSAPGAVANWLPFIVQRPIVWRGFPRQRQLVAPRVPLGPSGFGIRYATYGPADRMNHREGVDVAATVQALADGATVTFNADNGTLAPEGDPYPFIAKSLWIEWERADGVVTENHYPEGAVVELA